MKDRTSGFTLPAGHATTRRLLGRSATGTRVSPSGSAWVIGDKPIVSFQSTERRDRESPHPHDALGGLPRLPPRVPGHGDRYRYLRARTSRRSAGLIASRKSSPSADLVVHHLHALLVSAGCRGAGPVDR